MSNEKTVSTFSRLGEVFTGRLFQIPDYQRGYSWGEKQWMDLVEDLGQLDDETQQHFFGTIILHGQQEAGHIPAQNGQPFRYYDVVDGQQRLVTVTIFLDVLADALTEFDAQNAFDLKEQMVLVRDNTNYKIPRLQLNQDTDNFYKSVILNLTRGADPRETTIHRRLRGAKTFFVGYLAGQREILGAHYYSWLQMEVHKLTRQLRVILYAAEQEADAALIFAAMNDRGKPITEMEKVKSYLLYAARKLDVDSAVNLVAEINRTWKHIYSSLAAAKLHDRRSEDQLLRFHWLMAYNPLTKYWEGAKSIKEKFELNGDSEQQVALFKTIIEYLETLRSATTTYCDVYKPTRDGAFAELGADEETKKRIIDIIEISKKLVRLGSLATFLPLLMAVRIRYQDNALEYLETAELCELFTFRVYRWRRWKSHTGQSKFFSLAHQLFKGREIDAVQDDIRRLMFNYCTNEQFAERFQSKTENWFNWHGLKYFLYEYEQHLADQRNLGVQMQWDTVTEPNTIEHILPQTPDRKRYWSGRFKKGVYERYKHDIGNLTLTFDNRPMLNKPFYLESVDPQKSPEHKWYYYFKSALFMERELADHHDWRPEMVDERRQKIAEWAIERWLVDPPARPAEVSNGGRKYSIAKIQELADQYGVRELLDVLLKTCQQYGWGLKAWRWCITPAPPQSRRFALMAIYPKPGHLYVGVWLDQFPLFFRGVSGEDMREIIGPVDHQLDATNMNDFLGRLERVFSKIEGAK